MRFSRNSVLLISISGIWFFLGVYPVHGGLHDPVATPTQRLIDAVINGNDSEENRELIRSLISKEVDITRRANGGACIAPDQLPLFAYAKSPEIATILLREHPFIRIRTRSTITGETALHHAIKEK